MTQPMYRYSDEQVARACWAVLDIMNDTQGPPWADVPFESFTSLPADDLAVIIKGVKAARRGATPRELFEEWAAARRALGWTWGPVRDTERKTHPNLVRYYDLPASQRDKDQVFFGLVTNMTDVAPELPEAASGSAVSRLDAGSMSGRAAVVTAMTVYGRGLRPARMAIP